MEINTMKKTQTGEIQKMENLSKPTDTTSLTNSEY